MKKYILCMVSALMLSFSICVVTPTALAAEKEAVQVAYELYNLGLFSGVGINVDGTPNFELDRAPTRTEAITMLVRLLGKEEEAKEGTWAIPFVDVAEWAKPYVGYAYSNGLTTGISKTIFGGDVQLDVSQYLTFVLRALGYTSGIDFQWDKAWELSDQLGITDGQYRETSAFTRGDVVIISNRALSATLKGSKQKLSEKIGINTIKNNVPNTETLDNAEQTVSVLGILLDKEFITIKVGEMVMLEATLLPPNTEDRTITWQSTNRSVAIVSEGDVVGIGEGEATIVVKTANGKTALCEVVVEEEQIEKESAIELPSQDEYYEYQGENESEELGRPIRVFGENGWEWTTENKLKPVDPEENRTVQVFRNGQWIWISEEQIKREIEELEKAKKGER